MHAQTCLPATVSLRRTTRLTSVPPGSTKTKTKTAVAALFAPLATSVLVVRAPTCAQFTVTTVPTRQSKASAPASLVLKDSTAQTLQLSLFSALTAPTRMTGSQSAHCVLQACSALAAPKMRSLFATTATTADTVTKYAPAVLVATDATKSIWSPSNASPATTPAPAPWSARFVPQATSVPGAQTYPPSVCRRTGLLKAQWSATSALTELFATTQQATMTP